MCLRGSSWVDTAQQSKSNARSNSFETKTKQEDLLYDKLLKLGETVNSDRYSQQIINLNDVLIVKQPEDSKKQFGFMITYQNTLKNQSSSRFWTGKTLLLQITKCSGQ